MQGDTGSFSSYGDYDKSVNVLCSQRAEHTYEVTIASDQERNDLNYPSSIVDVWPETERAFSTSLVDSWRGTQENAFSSGGDLCWSPGSTQSWEEPSLGLTPQFQQPLRLTYGEAARKAPEEKPRHVPPSRSYYFDTSRCQYRTSKQEKCFPGDFRRPPPTPMKTVRQKLIEFVETEEFEEYSFLAVMTLLLAHMFRLTKEVFGICSSAHIIVSIFICIWRFMVVKVEDILNTIGWTQVGFKCAVLAVELLIIFVCIFLFFWAILIPVYQLFANILSKTSYLCP